MRVLSAHRNPAQVVELVSSARENGYVAFICGAGMAAHLAGVVAAHTTLPVVGVPLSGGALNGVDALYSTVQMPKGIPVATVAVDGSMNAALLVVEMLAISDDRLRDSEARYRDVVEALGLSDGVSVDTVREWGVRQLGKTSRLRTRSGIEKDVVLDLFPAYDDDGGLLVALTPG